MRRATGNSITSKKKSHWKTYSILLTQSTINKVFNYHFFNYIMTSNTLLFVDGVTGIVLIAVGAVIFFILAFFVVLSMFYKKIPQGKAIVRTGVGGTKVAFNKGMYVVPVFHRMEIM